MRRILEKTPLILKQFETENTVSRSRTRGKPRIASGMTNNPGKRSAGGRTPVSHFQDPFPAGSLNNSGQQSRASNSQGNEAEQQVGRRRSSIGPISSRRRRSSVNMNLNSNVKIFQGSEENILEDSTGLTTSSRHVAFSGEQLFTPAFSMEEEPVAYLPPINANKGSDSRARRKSMKPPDEHARFAVIEEATVSRSDNNTPAMKSQSSTSGGSGSRGYTPRKQSARVQTSDMNEIRIELTGGRRMSTVTGSSGGQLIDSVRKTMDMERNNNDVEIIVAKHALIDDYQQQINRIHESTKREITRLEEERKVIKALWKMKTETYKKMVRKGKGECQTILQKQEKLVKIAVSLTSSKTKDVGITCNLSGKCLKEVTKKTVYVSNFF
jgi:hypothetical protein